VVFVPGIGLTQDAVRPTIERGAAHWPASVVRLPGYGDPVPPGTDLRPERLADRLRRALDRDVAGDVVLVGHSASCQIVAEDAARDDLVAHGALPHRDRHPATYGTWLAAKLA
jgi:pimeloyl-ACP methyl ester carboxylesterase